MMRIVAPLWLALTAVAAAQTPATTFKFDFGSEKPAPGYFRPSGMASDPTAPLARS